MQSTWKAIGGLLLAGVLSIPAWADTNPARPGTLNYVEGQAFIANQPLDAKSVGSTELNAGQVLNTTNGRAEILLTPGVFLRLDNSSAVQMDSPGLADTVLTLQQGRALVEVDQISKDNNLVIREDGASARLTKKGLYEFSANDGRVRVFDGKAVVTAGDRKVDVGGGHQYAFDDTKARKFDKKDAQDDFYRWASLRSSYLAQANRESASVYVAGGTGWYGPGWYWNPWYSSYTWIPGAGVLWSPFGWGFYSPFTVYSAPIFVTPYHYVYRAPVHGFAHPFSGPRFSGPRNFGGAHAFPRGGMAHHSPSVSHGGGHR